MWHCRIRLRFYLLLLCLIYFTMLYVFYGRLQLEMGKNTQESLAAKFFTARHNSLSALLNVHMEKKAEIKRHVLGADMDERKPMFNFTQPSTVLKFLRNMNLTTKRSTKSTERIEENCFISSTYENRTFQALDPGTFVYSAYLDERYTRKMVRIMTIFNADKKNRAISFFCTFIGSKTTYRVKAAIYEMCENHGKMFGGYILSCDVPTQAVTVCQVNVSMEVIPVHRQYKPPHHQGVTVPVTRLGHTLPSTPPVSHQVLDNITHPTVPALTLYNVSYNFTICVPPLFGKIDTIRFVEFIELNRLLGFEHFIFYLGNVENHKIIDILNHYKKLDIVTVITWNLPFVMQKGKIWYNGQLNAHNDCLYRAMTISRYLAIIDIDEYIVPHNGDMTIANSITNLIKDTVGGVSFRSAFYDPKFISNNKKAGDKASLLTLTWTGRSSVYSNVRTKVLVKPERIFEVGIHHISKPAQEWLKVIKVNTSEAFLHHYRSCVPNYGMKCGSSMEDKTILKYEDRLLKNVAAVMKNVLSIDM